MSSSELLRPDDAGVWDAYCKDVTPLRGGKVPSSAPAPLGLAFSTPITTQHTLDLHGLTVAEAHTRTSNFLLLARSHYDYVTVVTGRSGAIRDEFLHWLSDDRGISRVEPLNGSGAFRIYFRKQRKRRGV